MMEQHEGAAAVAGTVSEEIRNLIADVEELLARIADLNDVDVVRMRKKVLGAVDAAKDALSDGAESVRRQAQRIAGTADEFVHDSPWQAVGIAALVGAVVGVLTMRRS